MGNLWGVGMDKKEIEKRSWKDQHIAFKLKWVFATAIEVTSIISLIVAKATFLEFLSAQTIIATIVACDAALKFKKIKNKIIGG